MENKDLKICKYCSSEIPKKASVCPNCKKDIRNWFVKHYIITFILVILVITPFMQWVDDWYNQGNIAREEKKYILPEYSVIDTTKLINWDTLVEILIPSFSKNTLKIDLESTSKEISKILSANQVDIYCSLEAQKANYSSIYMKEHPNAIEECSLWSYSY